MVTEEDIGRAIIGAAMKVHTIVGPGLLESAYETCLVYELEKLRLRARRQVAVPTILAVHRAQLLSYLRLGVFRLGYLLNFHVAHMRDGIVRLVNGL
jgi:hypothetical protein